MINKPTSFIINSDMLNYLCFNEKGKMTYQNFFLYLSKCSNWIATQLTSDKESNREVQKIISNFNRYYITKNNYLKTHFKNTLNSEFIASVFFSQLRVAINNGAITDQSVIDFTELFEKNEKMFLKKLGFKKNGKMHISTFLKICIENADIKSFLDSPTLQNKNCTSTQELISPKRGNGVKISIRLYGISLTIYDFFCNLRKQSSSNGMFTDMQFNSIKDKSDTDIFKHLIIFGFESMKSGKMPNEYKRSSPYYTHGNKRKVLDDNDGSLKKSITKAAKKTRIKRICETCFGSLTIYLEMFNELIDEVDEWVLNDLDINKYLTLKLIKDTPFALAEECTRFADTIQNKIDNEQPYNKILADTKAELSEKIKKYERSTQSDQSNEKLCAEIVARHILLHTSSSTERAKVKNNAGYANHIKQYRNKIKNIPLLHIALHSINTIITNENIIDCVKNNTSKDTLFIIDPPYLFTQEYNTKENNLAPFTEENHKELTEILRKSDGHIIYCGRVNKVCNSTQNDTINKKLESFFINEFCEQVKKTSPFYFKLVPISTSKSKTKTLEIILTNYKCDGYSKLNSKQLETKIPEI